MAVSSDGQDTMTFILTVEDEEPLREYLGEILEDAGYSVIAAANADEAIVVLESHDDICTVITGSGGAGQMAADQDHHCDRERRARSRRNAARQPVRAQALPAG
jgi:CheY-like chemotaxis protein